ncbi:MAG TPA: hypothetical protein VGM20_04305 [Gemmatimonadales bacterium]|jgi:hypothetical protein
MSNATSPAVGDIVVWDGEDHAVTAVDGTTIEFSADGGHSRGTDAQHLEPLGPNRWGVIGRSAKRPHRKHVGLQITPAKES